MTDSELEEMERALNVSLPDDYRRMILNYPIRAYRNSTNSILWDNLARLIKMNLDYRTGFAGLIKPWPANLLFIGDDGTACPYVLDLRDPACRVVHLDHGDPDRILEEWPDLASWMNDYIEGCDIDVNAEKKPEPSILRIACYCLLVAGIMAAVGTLVGRLLVR